MCTFIKSFQFVGDNASPIVTLFAVIRINFHEGDNNFPRKTRNNGAEHFHGPAISLASAKVIRTGWPARRAFAYEVDRVGVMAIPTRTRVHDQSRERHRGLYHVPRK